MDILKKHNYTAQIGGVIFFPVHYSASFWNLSYTIKRARLKVNKYDTIKTLKMNCLHFPSSLLDFVHIHILIVLCFTPADILFK